MRTGGMETSNSIGPHQVHCHTTDLPSGATVPSLHNDLGPVHGVKAKPLRDRFCDSWLRYRQVRMDLAYAIDYC